MAKRKRLTPAQPEYLGGAPDNMPADLETKVMFPLGVARHGAPIAQMAGASAEAAALRELSDELRAARDEGRLVQALALDAVDVGYLVRDRIQADDEDMATLVESLRSRGQQTPIEVVDLSEGQFGLISGWRRMTALRRLLEETGEDRFARVHALLRRPDTASDAYLAMVEENEIRVGLSYYERARIVARAAERGVFADETAALRGLFASASRAKRSKIGSFLPLYHQLDGRLRFPSAIPERLGLALSKALGADPDLGRKLSERLRKAEPDDAAAEQALLLRASGRPEPAPSPAPPRREPTAPDRECAPGVFLAEAADGQSGYRLYGPNVDAGFRDRLVAWLNTAATG